MARPDPAGDKPEVKNVWHRIADDLAAMPYSMSPFEWALFDRWRLVWAAA